MIDLLHKAIQLSNRRIILCTNLVIKCPQCGEDEQIELIDYTTVPAEWKCRQCKHKWGYEPSK